MCVEGLPQSLDFEFFRLFEQIDWLIIESDLNTSCAQLANEKTERGYLLIDAKIRKKVNGEKGTLGPDTVMYGLSLDLYYDWDLCLISVQFL